MLTCDSKMKKQVEDYKHVLEWLQTNIDKPGKPILFVNSDFIFLKGSEKDLFSLLSIAEERLEVFPKTEDGII